MSTIGNLKRKRRNANYLKKSGKCAIIISLKGSSSTLSELIRQDRYLISRINYKEQDFYRNIRVFFVIRNMKGSDIFYNIFFIIRKEVKNMKELLFNKKIRVIGILGIILLILLSTSFTTIKSGEVGIRIRFGKVLDQNTNEGVNYKLPFIERIEKMNVRVQKIEISTDSSSKDLQDVEMTLAVNYQIKRKEAKNLYKTVGNGYREVILQPAIEESIKAVTSKYTAEELITNRSEVSTKCMEELNKKVEKYGLTINDFNITNFSFSQEFEHAIEEKQVAEQKVLTAKQELEKEKIEAEKKVVAAEAEKKANELKQASLTENIIKEKMIEKWNGELPKVTGSNNIMDISNIMN